MNHGGRLNRIENSLAGFRFIQSVKMHARNTCFDQIFTLLNRMLNTDFKLSRSVILNGFQSCGQVGREFRATH